MLQTSAIQVGDQVTLYTNVSNLQVVVANNKVVTLTVNVGSRDGRDGRDGSRDGTRDETRQQISFTPKVVVDASYEGDVLRMSGASYALGRESNTSYNEPHAGIQPWSVGQLCHCDNAVTPFQPRICSRTLLGAAASCPHFLLTCALLMTSSHWKAIPWVRPRPDLPTSSKLRGEPFRGRIEHDAAANGEQRWPRWSSRPVPGVKMNAHIGPPSQVCFGTCREHW